jgi:hypothetical protein
LLTTSTGVQKVNLVQHDCVYMGQHVAVVSTTAAKQAVEGLWSSDQHVRYSRERIAMIAGATHYA